MSSRPSPQPSPSTSPKHNRSPEPSEQPELPSQQTSSNSLVETPQYTAGQLLRSAPASDSQPAPLIIVTDSPASSTPERAERAASVPRQGRPLVSRRRTGHSYSQPPKRSSTPYSRRSRSDTRQQTLPTMSSAGSSPGNTSTSGATAGSGSGSNPGYHLPYAPFPYPMPGNARPGQGNQSGGNSGK